MQYCQVSNKLYRRNFKPMAKLHLKLILLSKIVYKDKKAHDIDKGFKKQYCYLHRF